MNPLISKLRNDTYLNAKRVLAETNDCVIIRPTGFGKTGILTKFIDDYTNILYLYPSDVVRQAVLRFYYQNNIPDDKTIDNVTFMTYTKLAMMKKSEILNLPQYDCIILDECHKVGAIKTCNKLDMLLDSQRETHTCHLIGATATPDRMDSVDEISRYFGINKCFEYNLHNAFQDNVLQRPYYFFCKYADTDNLDKMVKDLTDSELRKIYKKKSEISLRNDLSARMIEMADMFNMENVVYNICEQYAPSTEYMKFVCFFSSFDSIKTNGPKVKEWFSKAYPTHKVHTLEITSETTDTHANVHKLRHMTATSNKIDLIFTCDMMNMGYHVDDLTGIVMYRGTKSGTVYIQQLGRILSSGASNAGIVIDVVDNIHQHSVYRVLDGTSIYTKNAKTRMTSLQKKKDDDVQHNTSKFTKRDDAELKGLERRFSNPEKMKQFFASNTLQKEDLIAIDYEASYRELIAKTVAEAKSMRCRQAWARWLEVRAQENRPSTNHGKPFTRQEILDMTPPNDIPLPPFCYAKQVSIDAVLDEMNVPK